MRTVCLIAVALAVLPTIVAASPQPVLPWASAIFSFALDSGTVEFRMECPDGKLKRLSAVRGQQVAEMPIAQLAALGLSDTCAGASTRAETESEGSRLVTGISFRIQLSHEYVNEELWIDFDLQLFRFTKAMHLKWRGGDEQTDIKRVEFK